MKTRGPLAGFLLSTAALLPADVNSSEKNTATSAIQPVLSKLAADFSTKTKKDASKFDDGEPTSKESSEKTQGPAPLKAKKNADPQTNSKETSKKTQIKSKPLKRQVLVVKATWCGACQALRHEWPKLRKVRWRIGGTNTDHFQLIDVDANPDVAGRYGITQLPTLLLIENGKVIQRAGGLNAKEMANFYYGRL